MGENTVQTEKAPKKSRFKGLVAEFKKIIWPDKESLAKQTVTVCIVTFALAIVISLLDTVIKFGINLFI